MNRPADGREPRAESVVPDRTLDTIGLFCPVPIIKTAQAMKEMAPGQVLLLVSDDRGVLVDLPAWCRMAKADLLSLVEDGAIVRGLVRKPFAPSRSGTGLPSGL